MSSSGLYVKNGYLYKEGVGRIHKATDEEASKYTSTPSTGSVADTTTPTASSGAATAAKPDNSIESYLAQNGVSPSLLSGGGSAGRGSYKVTSADRPARTGYLRSAKELGELYDINYDMDAIRGIYDDATNAKYALLSKELEQGENDFYTNQANANATLLDTLKKATSSAIATGASRGIAGAEQLGLMMEQQQSIAEEATNLAQERANMADEIAAEKAQNIIDALEYSDSLKTTLGNLSSNIYSADTQYDVGLLDWAAQMKNVEALFEQIAAEKETNLAAQALQKELGLLEDERLRTEGAADREAQKYVADQNLAGNKYAADQALAGNKYVADRNYAASKYAADKSGYSSGSGVEDYLANVKAVEQLMEEAYAAGDVGSYITYRMARNALTNNTSETQSDIFDIVMKDKYFKNSDAWKKAQGKSNEDTIKIEDFKIQQPTLPGQDLVNVIKDAIKKETLKKTQPTFTNYKILS